MSVRFTASELRREFDAAFAEPAADGEDAPVSFLRVRVGDAPYALALSEVATVEACRGAARVPSSVSGLVGVVEVHGSPAALFDLLSLLRGCAPEPRRWLVSLRADPTVAVAVDTVEGLLRLSAGSAISPPDVAQPKVIRRVLDDEGTRRPVIDLGAALAEIRARAGRWGGTP